jgi:glycosyltransferase involved in cell wall biosynthesis
MRSQDKTIQILAIAYACDPSQGSEPGAGWMWSRLLSRLGRTTVITRENNREPIEAALSSIPEAPRMDFVYVDLPAWARFWKRGKRGTRAYYLLWQFAALRAARKGSRNSQWDVVWHLTFANFWLGSVGGLLGLPFIWGPVGGGVPSCFDIRVVGLKGLLFEMSRSVGRGAGRWSNPLARSAWRRAKLILVNNLDVRASLPAKYGSKCVVFPHVLLEEDRQRAASIPPEPKTALFAGRLVPWKGCSLALHALVLLPEWRLLVCGRGPDETRLKRLARKLGVDDRVEFLGWVDRSDVQRIMRERAHVFLFPSLHDDAPWVVGEAVANGLPVVCLDRGGAPLVGGSDGVPVDTVGEMAAGLSTKVSAAARQDLSKAWDMEVRDRELLSVLRDFNLLARAAAASPPKTRSHPATERDVHWQYAWTSDACVAVPTHPEDRGHYSQ